MGCLPLSWMLLSYFLGHLFVAGFFQIAFASDFDVPHPRNVYALGQFNNSLSHWHRSLKRRSPEVTPLYPGYGTHFAYIFVGTPPQRQSVIIDTGSHYTAFPCVGCSGCGQHTDGRWNLKESSTHYVPTCNHGPCVLEQSYSEGSSWKAFKVVDKLWVGGAEYALFQGAESYAIEFIFGCQMSETGAPVHYDRFPAI